MFKTASRFAAFSSGELPVSVSPITSESIARLMSSAFRGVSIPTNLSIN